MTASQSIPTDPRFKNLLGSPPFGRLTVTAFAGRAKQGFFWLCTCACGKQTKVRTSALTSGAIVSCGCWRRERMRQTAIRHGKSRSKEYSVWFGMRMRCEDPRNRFYPEYGGRGIGVCERWLDFVNFYADMGDCPSPRHTLDRFPDNNGNYEPGNCRWATAKEQQRNKRDNRLVEYRGETRCVTEWAEILGVSAGRLFDRLRRNWTCEEAIGNVKRSRKSGS